ncbi:MAG: hypothetical protein KDB27_00020 [Planctomycetales bacterium]|nr:hypothetical protein [Planctomycetales bacterium]
MNEATTDQPKASTDSNAEITTGQVVISMLVGLHIVFLLACVFSGNADSQLVRRLASTAAPHCAIGLRTNYAPDFHLSQSMDFEDDHHFEVVVGNEVVAKFPSAQTNETGSREGFRYQRFRKMARQAAKALVSEDDATLSELVRGIGEYVNSRDGTERMVIRLVAFRPYDWREEPPQALADSLDPVFYEELYAADVWLARSGDISVHKRVPPAEAAPPVGSSK